MNAFKKTSSILMILFLLFTIISCENPVDDDSIFPPDNHEKVTIQQGVWGNVWFWEGDFMPSTDPHYSAGKITPVVREIFVYEATPDSLTEKPSNSGTFFTKINSLFITKISSDPSGFFQLVLEPGKYSFFVKEDSLFYANLWDGNGNIQTAEVIKNQVTKRQIDIDYRAVY